MTPTTQTTDDTVWTDRGDNYWRRMGHGGQRLLVSHVSCGWDASITYASGTTVRAPRYYASRKSAMAWCDRQAGV